MFIRNARADLLEVALFLQEPLHQYETLHGYKVLHLKHIQGYLIGVTMNCAVSRSSRSPAEATESSWNYGIFFHNYEIRCLFFFFCECNALLYRQVTMCAKNTETAASFPLGFVFYSSELDASKLRVILFLAPFRVHLKQHTEIIFKEQRKKNMAKAVWVYKMIYVHLHRKNNKKKKKEKAVRDRCKLTCYQSCIMSWIFFKEKDKKRKGKSTHECF